jgi:type IV pilus assembly protein PilM
MFKLFRKQQPIIGINMSDYSIEILQLNKKREVLAYGREVLEEGTIRYGTILNKEKLVKKIKSLLENTKPNKLEISKKLKVILSLPETKTFIYYFDLPEILQGEDLKRRIHEEASKIIPFKPEEIYWDYLVIPGEEIQHVLYAGTLKKIADDYAEVMKKSGLDLIVLDIESGSLGPALLESSFIKSASMIVDIGANTTTLSIFDNKCNLYLSVTIPVGGNHFTKVIAEKLNKGYDEAEELKRTFGFDDKKANNNVLPILEDCFQKIIKEIQDAIKYYEGKFSIKVENIILVGGSALLPNFNEYLKLKLARKVIIGDPIEKIKNFEISDRKDPVLFTNVIGLALRGVNNVSAGINFLKPKLTTKTELLRKFQILKLPFLHLFQVIQERRFLLTVLFLIITFLILGFIIYQYIVKLPVQ